MTNDGFPAVSSLCICCEQPIELEYETDIDDICVDCSERDGDDEDD